MSFKENLAKLRVEKNIAEEKMAETLACTLKEYQELESGEREPKMQELIACAKALEVSTDFLLDHLEKKQDNKKQAFDPLSALAGMALPGGFSINPDNGDEEDDIDEELALQLAEMASAIDTKRRRKDDGSK